MARPLREFAEGLWHVGSHGSDTRHLYQSVGDRLNFLERLAEACRRFELELVAYVLMGNHYHAVLWIPDARLSDALRRLHTGYSRLHNRIHGRSAHLFRAHCLAKPIESNEHLLTALRYLALNPVEAGLVDHPLDWRWGSARVHAGLEAPLVPLEERYIKAAFDDDPGWRLRFRALIEPEAEQPVSDTRFWQGQRVPTS